MVKINKTPIIFQKHLFLNALVVAILFMCISCAPLDDTPLPVYGQKKIIGTDTIEHAIPDFAFLNQDSVMITNESLKEHIYIADFFYTYCPSICPKVMRQMLDLYDIFESDPRVKFVSYTLDPKRDSIPRLKQYADNLDIDSDKWWFLHGDQDSIHDLADDYFVVAIEDASVPGGFDHSGKILLVDHERHIRGFAEGTDPEDVEELVPVIKQLLRSYEQKQK